MKSKMIFGSWLWLLLSAGSLVCSGTEHPLHSATPSSESDWKGPDGKTRRPAQCRNPRSSSATALVVIDGLVLDSRDWPVAGATIALARRLDRANPTAPQLAGPPSPVPEGTSALGNWRPERSPRRQARRPRGRCQPCRRASSSPAESGRSPGQRRQWDSGAQGRCWTTKAASSPERESRRARRRRRNPRGTAPAMS